MTLHRLVLREIGFPLLLSLILVTQLLVAMQMLQLNDLLFGSGFDPVVIVRVAAYFLPHFGIIAVPLAFLFAVMLGLGRLAEDNEIVALTALGRSPRALYLVPVLMSVLLGLFVGGLAARGEAWGLGGLRRQLNELIKRNVAGDVVAGTFYDDLPRFTLYVGKVAGERWNDVLLHDSAGDGTPLLVFARSARVKKQGAETNIQLALTDGELHRTDGATYTHAHFEDGTVSLGVTDFFKQKNKFARPAAEVFLDDLPGEWKRAAEAGQASRARSLETNFHRRIASAFACPVFGLVAVPLAASGRGARRRSFVATLLAFAGYYILLTLGVSLAETGRLSAMAGAWLPNLVGLVLAVGLAIHLHRVPPGADR